MSNSRRDFIKKSLFLGAALSTPMALSAMFTNQEDLTFSVDELMGKANPKMYGNGYKLRKEVHESLVKLTAAAKNDGFSPYVVSSYRNYNHQKRIWDNKYIKYTREQKLSPEKAIEKIIAYSTIPGTSRHHWGTDFDIIDGAKGVANNPLNERHFNKGGVYHEFKLWMNKHAEDFGFYEVYTNAKDRKGFKYEPWHFSYLPTSCEMLREYIDKGVIQIIQSSDIQGAKHITAEFLERYYNENVLDINAELIP